MPPTSLEFPSYIPFAELLGLKLLRYEGGECDLSLDPQSTMLNSWSVVHGGATMTLLDVGMSHAARSAAAGPDGDRHSAATIEMKVSFMRPGTGPLLSRSRVLHRTATMAFVEGRVEDGKGELVAHATGTFKYLRAMPTSDGRVMPLNAPASPRPPAGGDA